MLLCAHPAPAHNAHRTAQTYFMWPFILCQSAQPDFYRTTAINFTYREETHSWCPLRFRENCEEYILKEKKKNTSPKQNSAIFFEDILESFSAHTFSGVEFSGTDLKKKKSPHRQAIRKSFKRVRFLFLHTGYINQLCPLSGLLRLKSFNVAHSCQN